MRLSRGVWRSVGNTWSTHSQIGRFPLPKLEDTLNGYIEAVSPLLDTEALNRTTAVVKEVTCV